MDENRRIESRDKRRMHHREICGYQRAIAGLLSVSVAGNAAMYWIMRHREAKHADELEKLNDKLQYAERVKEQAIEQYGGLVLELQRYSMDVEKSKIAKKEDAEEPYKYIGECIITYYCCEQYPHICGSGDGLTATGSAAEPGIIAVDPSVIPLGSTVVIDGDEYLASDTGGSVKGMHVDICTDTHEHALELGTHTADVWIVNE